VLVDGIALHAERNAEPCGRLARHKKYLSVRARRSAREPIACDEGKKKKKKAS